MAETWYVEVGKECVSSGSCWNLDPEHFERGGDGYSRPVTDEIEASDAAVDARATCPVEAIRLTRTADDQEVPW
jgi:ferredoxin